MQNYYTRDRRKIYVLVQKKYSTQFFLLFVIKRLILYLYQLFSNYLCTIVEEEEKKKY